MTRRTLACVLLLSAALVSCGRLSGSDESGETDASRDFRADMRTFVQRITAAAREQQSAFIVVPQNGQQLLSLSARADAPAVDYLAAIDGVGREDLLYGYETDNQPTPAGATDEILPYLRLAQSAGKSVLVTDYCSDAVYVDDSYARNAAAGFVSFAADRRELDDVPVRPIEPYNVNADDVGDLAQARNFAFVLSPESFGSRGGYLAALRATRFDLLIIDLFYDGQALTRDEVESLKTKAGGGRRLVVCYLSIGEAERYRFYWSAAWASSPPSFLERPNPDFPDNYKVRYWDESWQSIIVGSGDSYLSRILDAGFDGVYLDIIDAFEYFEDLAG